MNVPKWTYTEEGIWAWNWILVDSSGQTVFVEDTHGNIHGIYPTDRVAAPRGGPPQEKSA